MYTVKNHHGVGTFGQHVLSIELIGVDGKTKVVTPRKNKALYEATIGGLGQTGIIVSAKLQLTECSSRLIQVDERRANNLAEFMQMLKDSTATYCVGWIDGTANGQSLGRGILEEAELTKSNMAPKLRKSRKVPFNAPSFALSPPTVRAFNRMYFNRVPATGRGVFAQPRRFLLPARQNPRLEQAVWQARLSPIPMRLPDDTAERTLREMLRLIADAGLASPLAVLKRTGPGRAGPMSFTMEGFTLALDFPNSAKSVALVEKLNELTTEAGGRIYFAKDSLATAAQAKQMYPELAACRKPSKPQTQKAVSKRTSCVALNFGKANDTGLGFSSAQALPWVAHSLERPQQWALMLFSLPGTKTIWPARPRIAPHVVLHLPRLWCLTPAIQKPLAPSIKPRKRTKASSMPPFSSAPWLRKMTWTQIQTSVTFTIQDNFTGPANFLHGLAPIMEERKDGTVLGIGSVAGDRGRIGNYTYGSAKAGFHTYLSGLRNRLNRSGGHVVTVKPGFVDTAMTWGIEGMFLVASPDQIADDLWTAHEKKKNTLYTPWFWRYIMAIIKSIPEPIFKKLSV